MKSRRGGTLSWNLKPPHFRRNKSYYQISFGCKDTRVKWKGNVGQSKDRTVFVFQEDRVVRTCVRSITRRFCRTFWGGTQIPLVHWEFWCVCSCLAVYSHWGVGPLRRGKWWNSNGRRFKGKFPKITGKVHCSLILNQTVVLTRNERENFLFEFRVINFTTNWKFMTSQNKTKTLEVRSSTLKKYTPAPHKE